jgi:hypothetical protein
MRNIDSQRGAQTRRQRRDPDFNLETGRWSRGPDRRGDGERLFAYEGPERRSRRDRRVPG